MIKSLGLFMVLFTVSLLAEPPTPSPIPTDPPPVENYCIFAAQPSAQDKFIIAARDCSNVEDGCPIVAFICEFEPPTDECSCPCDGGSIPEDCIKQAEKDTEETIELMLRESANNRSSLQRKINSLKRRCGTSR